MSPQLKKVNLEAWEEGLKVDGVEETPDGLYFPSDTFEFTMNKEGVAIVPKKDPEPEAKTVHGHRT